MQDKNHQAYQLIEAGPQAEGERMRDDSETELGRLKMCGIKALLY